MALRERPRARGEPGAAIPRWPDGRVGRNGSSKDDEVGYDAGKRVKGRRIHAWSTPRVLPCASWSTRLGCRTVTAPHSCRRASAAPVAQHIGGAGVARCSGGSSVRMACSSVTASRSRARSDACGGRCAALRSRKVLRVAEQARRTSRGREDDGGWGSAASILRPSSSSTRPALARRWPGCTAGRPREPAWSTPCRTAIGAPYLRLRAGDDRPCRSARLSRADDGAGLPRRRRAVPRNGTCSGQRRRRGRPHRPQGRRRARGDRGRREHRPVPAPLRPTPTRSRRSSPSPKGLLRGRREDLRTATGNRCSNPVRPDANAPSSTPAIYGREEALPARRRYDLEGGRQPSVVSRTGVPPSRWCRAWRRDGRRWLADARARMRCSSPCPGADVVRSSLTGGRHGDLDVPSGPCRRTVPPGPAVAG